MRETERERWQYRKSCRLKLLWFRSRWIQDLESTGLKSFTDGEDKWWRANERQEKSEFEYPWLPYLPFSHTNHQTRLLCDSIDPRGFYRRVKMRPWDAKIAVTPSSFECRARRATIALESEVCSLTNNSHSNVCITYENTVGTNIFIFTDFTLSWNRGIISSRQFFRL